MTCLLLQRIYEEPLLLSDLNVVLTFEMHSMHIAGGSRAMQSRVASRSQRRIQICDAWALSVSVPKLLLGSPLGAAHGPPSSTSSSSHIAGCTGSSSSRSVQRMNLPSSAPHLELLAEFFSIHGSPHANANDMGYPLQRLEELLKAALKRELRACLDSECEMNANSAGSNQSLSLLTTSCATECVTAAGGGFSNNADMVVLLWYSAAAAILMMATRETTCAASFRNWEEKEQMLDAVLCAVTSRSTHAKEGPDGLSWSIGVPVSVALALVASVFPLSVHNYNPQRNGRSTSLERRLVLCNFCRSIIALRASESSSSLRMLQAAVALAGKCDEAPLTLVDLKRLRDAKGLAAVDVASEERRLTPTMLDLWRSSSHLKPHERRSLVGAHLSAYCRRRREGGPSYLALTGRVKTEDAGLELCVMLGALRSEMERRAACVDVFRTLSTTALRRGWHHSACDDALNESEVQQWESVLDSLHETSWVSNDVAATVLTAVNEYVSAAARLEDDISSASTIFVTPLVLWLQKEYAHLRVANSILGGRGIHTMPTAPTILDGSCLPLIRDSTPGSVLRSAWFVLCSEPQGVVHKESEGMRNIRTAMEAVPDVEIAAWLHADVLLAPVTPATPQLVEAVLEVAIEVCRERQESLSRVTAGNAVSQYTLRNRRAGLRLLVEKWLAVSSLVAPSLFRKWAIVADELLSSLSLSSSGSSDHPAHPDGVTVLQRNSSASVAWWMRCLWSDSASTNSSAEDPWSAAPRVLHQSLTFYWVYLRGKTSQLHGDESEGFLRSAKAATPTLGMTAVLKGLDRLFRSVAENGRWKTAAELHSLLNTFRGSCNNTAEWITKDIKSLGLLEAAARRHEETLRCVELVARIAHSAKRGQWFGALAAWSHWTDTHACASSVIIKNPLTGFDSVENVRHALSATSFAAQQVRRVTSGRVADGVQQWEKVMAFLAQHDAFAMHNVKPLSTAASLIPPPPRSQHGSAGRPKLRVPSASPAELKLMASLVHGTAPPRPDVSTSSSQPHTPIPAASPATGVNPSDSGGVVEDRNAVRIAEALSRCARLGLWEEALSLLGHATSLGAAATFTTRRVHHRAVTYALHACQTAGKWERTLELAVAHASNPWRRFRSIGPIAEATIASSQWDIALSVVSNILVPQTNLALRRSPIASVAPLISVLHALVDWGQYEPVIRISEALWRSCDDPLLLDLLMRAFTSCHRWLEAVETFYTAVRRGVRARDDAIHHALRSCEEERRLTMTNVSVHVQVMAHGNAPPFSEHVTILRQVAAVAEALEDLCNVTNDIVVHVVAVYEKYTSSSNTSAQQHGSQRRSYVSYYSS